MVQENKKSVKCDVELPQSIIDSFAKFLVPEIRKFYETEEGKQTLAEWEAEHPPKENKRH